MEGPSGNRQLLQSKLLLLKNHIAKLAFDYMQDNRDIPLLTEEIRQLISILVEHFHGFYMEDFQYKTSQKDLSPDDLQRLCRITRYIMLNYREKISLEDVSRMEHLSSYYLSHLIKENLGFNFQNFVNAIRLEYAEKLLVFSNMTLMQISQECGFSSPNYFNKCFSAWHGKTPAQYRKEYIPCKRSYKQAFSRKEALELLSSYLDASAEGKRHSRRLSINPDFHAEGFMDFWDSFSPAVILDSIDSLLMLGHCSRFLMQVHPTCLLADELMVKGNRDLESCFSSVPPEVPAVTVCDISQLQFLRGEDTASLLEAMHCKGSRHVFLTGKEEALFTKEGLRTPIFQLYHWFSMLHAPQILFQEHYALVKSDGLLAVLLFNPDRHETLHVQLAAQQLPPHSMISKRVITSRETCFSALEHMDTSGRIPPLLMNEADHYTRGKLQFLQREDNFEFLLTPGTVIVLECFTVSQQKH